MSLSKTVSRRTFIGSTAATMTAFAAPSIIPGSALGADGKPAPSQRINVGMIATGRQAIKKNMRQFCRMPDVQILAVCDVDGWRRQYGKAAVEKAYGRAIASGKYKGCDAYLDFNEILGRDDIDAVMISSPDHWHAPMAIAAAKAGKDVSLEKPITRTIAEGQAIVKAVQENDRIFRVDSEFRSMKSFHRLAELVRNGRVGQIKSIHVGVPNHDNRRSPALSEMPVPEELDYEQWQGLAPRAPYTEARVHRPKGFGRPGWMRILNYCDGMVTNWGTHLCDIAQWCNNTERTGPVEIEGTGKFQEPGKLWNVLRLFNITYRFADGTPLYYETTKPYVRFEGTEGWIQATFPYDLKAEPASLLTSEIKPEEIHFPLKSDKQDFIDAVKTRSRTLEDEVVGHRTTSLCQLGHIAVQTGEKLKWDPEKEQFTNNEAANQWIAKPFNEPQKT